MLKPGTYPTRWAVPEGHNTSSFINVSHLDATDSELKEKWPSVKTPEFVSDAPRRRCGKIGDILFALDGPTATVEYKLAGPLDCRVHAKVGLSGKSARYYLDDKRPSLEVPVGTYGVQYVKLMARDENGTDWGLTYSNRSPFDTKARQTHTIPLGGKISLTIANRYGQQPYCEARRGKCNTPAA